MTCKQCGLPKRKDSWSRATVFDPHELRDIALTIENDSLMYRQRLVPWAKNAARRMKNKTFNRSMFIGGLARNLSKPAIERYFQILRRGRPPTIPMSVKKKLALLLAPSILEMAEEIAGGERY